MWHTIKMCKCIAKFYEEIPVILLLEMFTLVRVISVLILVTFSDLYNLFESG